MSTANNAASLEERQKDEDGELKPPSPNFLLERQIPPRGRTQRKSSRFMEVLLPKLRKLAVKSPQIRFQSLQRARSQTYRTKLYLITSGIMTVNDFSHLYHHFYLNY